MGGLEGLPSKNTLNSSLNGDAASGGLEGLPSKNTLTSLLGDVAAK